MKQILSSLIVFFVILSPVSVSFAKSDCRQKHGALDIGSGTTKAFAAWIDVCKMELIEAIFDEQIPIAFNEALEKSATGEIPANLVNEAGTKIGELTKKMRALEIKEISAIATSALRKATNGPEVAQIISEKTGITVKIISQDEEAEIGYVSALAQAKLPEADRNNVIVWDIGGGSMQMLFRENGTTSIFKGDLASVNFKNRIIQELQRNDPKTTLTPNPLKSQRMKAVNLARDHARKNVPTEFKKRAPRATWIGIGGVLSISARNQVTKELKKDSNSFTRSDLERTLKARAALTDEQIGGDYKTTEITNLALVLGYMQALEIKKVETAKANLTQGWLLYRLPAVR
jgi:exopolyphosphatase / guanosine-5'-triphosphate,3'-diphosphate pyrophosphatase